jgi:hypothetical protein
MNIQRSVPAISLEYPRAGNVSGRDGDDFTADGRPYTEEQRPSKIDGKRQEDASEGAKERCSWDSLPPHYSVCSSISRREMAKARAPLFPAGV